MNEDMLFEMVREINGALLAAGSPFTLEAEQKPKAYWKLHVHDERNGQKTTRMVALNVVEMIQKLAGMILAINLMNGVQ